MGDTSPGLVFLGLLTVIIDVWAIVNVIRRPSFAFEAAGKSKGLWVVLMAVGFLLCNIGFFLAVFYLVFVDPQVKRAERQGPGIGFPGSGSNFPR